MTTVCNNATVLRVIENGLNTLGNSPKQTIWIFLESEFKVKREELPENIDAFHEGLQAMFGPGYKFLDTLFCHYLEKETEKQFQRSLTFVERVKLLFYQENKMPIDKVV